MFPGLGHKAFVSRHYQQGKVNAAGAGQHIFYKFFVAGHVNNASLFPVGQIQVGEAQLYGNAPLFFFLDAVGFNAG